MTYVLLAGANEVPRIIACLFALLPRHLPLPRPCPSPFLLVSLGEVRTGGTTSCHAPVINFHAGRTMRRAR